MNLQETFGELQETLDSVTGNIRNRGISAEYLQVITHTRTEPSEILTKKHPEGLISQLTFTDSY